MQETIRANLKKALQSFIDAEADMLLRSIRLYAARAHLARGPALEEMAHELLNETVAEALAHVERFEDVESPHAWLLGIAANLVLRRQNRQIKRRQREPLARDISGAHLAEDEMFDRLRTAARITDPAHIAEARDTIAYLLAPLTPDDRYLVRLAVLLEMSRREMAKELGISPVAARVRLHRALTRLRKAWEVDCDE